MGFRGEHAWVLKHEKTSVVEHERVERAIYSITDGKFWPNRARLWTTDEETL
jgi:hypothetical protein